MGAWGYGPYDNDTAGDWLADTLAPSIQKAVRRFMRSRDDDGMDEAVAAVQLAVDQGVMVFGGSSEHGAFFDKVAECDEGRGWRNPSGRRKAMAKLRAASRKL